MPTNGRLRQLVSRTLHPKSALHSPAPNPRPIPPPIAHTSIGKHAQDSLSVIRRYLRLGLFNDNEDPSWYGVSTTNRLSVRV